MRFTRRQAAAALLTSVFWAPASVHGQSVSTYPEKPVRVISALAPSGAVDNMGRMVAAKLSENLRRQFIVENRLGGGGAIGYTFAARAPRDGYTLLVAGSGYTIAAVLNDFPFDPLKDLVPITRVSSVTYLLVTHPALPAKSVRELVALAKARPKALNYGSGGVGSAVHFAMEIFTSVAGINLTHVPYKGAGQAQTDLVSGELQLMMTNLTAILPHVTAGRVRALGVSEGQRSIALPQVPTIQESGLPYKHSGWIGFLAPGGVPNEIIEKLNVEIQKTMKDPVIAKNILDAGSMPTDTREEFAQAIRNEIAMNRKIVQKANIKAE